MLPLNGNCQVIKKCCPTFDWAANLDSITLLAQVWRTYIQDLGWHLCVTCYFYVKFHVFRYCVRVIPRYQFTDAMNVKMNLMNLYDSPRIKSNSYHLITPARMNEPTGLKSIETE